MHMDSFYKPRQYRLATLRRVLARPYGAHADAVISLTGNHMAPAVLEAALQKNLLEAHARKNLTVDGMRALKAVLESNPSASHYFGWQNYDPLPRWMGERLTVNTPHDFSARRKTLPYFSHQSFYFPDDPDESPARFIVVHPLGRESPAAGFVHFTDQGDVLNSFGPYSNCLWVETIQKATGDYIRKEMRGIFGLDLGPEMTTSKRRLMKDWAHSGLDLTEQLSRELDRRYVVVNLASYTDASSDKPLHEMLLHYYGRILLERGYRLQEIPWEKRPGRFDLAWVKDMRRFPPHERGEVS